MHGGDAASWKSSPPSQLPVPLLEERKMKGGAGRTWHLAFGAERAGPSGGSVCGSPRRAGRVSRGSGPTCHLPPPTSHRGVPAPATATGQCPPCFYHPLAQGRDLGHEVFFLQLVTRGTELAVVGEWGQEGELPEVRMGSDMDPMCPGTSSYPRAFVPCSAKTVQSTVKQ